jgi:hypothetical protein
MFGSASFAPFAQPKRPSHPSNGKNVYIMFKQHIKPQERVAPAVVPGAVLPLLNNKAKKPPPRRFSCMILNPTTLQVMYEKNKPDTHVDTSTLALLPFTEAFFACFGLQDCKKCGIYTIPAATFSRYLDPKDGLLKNSLNAPEVLPRQGDSISRYLAGAPFEATAIPFSEVRSSIEVGTYSAGETYKMFFVSLQPQMEVAGKWFPNQPTNTVYGQIPNFLMETTSFEYEDIEKKKHPFLAISKDLDLQVFVQQIDPAGVAHKLLVMTRLYEETIDRFQLHELDGVYDWVILGHKFVPYLQGTMICTVAREATSKLVVIPEMLATFAGVVKAWTNLEVDLAKTVRPIGIPISAQHAKQMVENTQFRKPMAKKFDLSWTNAVNLLTCADLNNAMKWLNHPNMVFYVVCNHGMSRNDIASLNDPDMAFRCIMGDPTCPVEARYVTGRPVAFAVYAMVDETKYPVGQVPTLLSMLVDHSPYTIPAAVVIPAPAQPVQTDEDEDEHAKRARFDQKMEEALVRADELARSLPKSSEEEEQKELDRLAKEANEEEEKAKRTRAGRYGDFGEYEQVGEEDELNDKLIQEGQKLSIMIQNADSKRILASKEEEEEEEEEAHEETIKLTNPMSSSSSSKTRKKNVIVDDDEEEWDPEGKVM